MVSLYDSPHFLYVDITDPIEYKMSTKVQTRHGKLGQAHESKKNYSYFIKRRIFNYN